MGSVIGQGAYIKSFPNIETPIDHEEEEHGDVICEYEEFLRFIFRNTKWNSFLIVPFFKDVSKPFKLHGRLLSYKGQRVERSKQSQRVYNILLPKFAFRFFR